MRIKIDGESEVFIIADQTGLKLYNIGEGVMWLYVLHNTQSKNSSLAPLTEIGRIDVGSLVSASNVARTNVLALVGGGERPKFRKIFIFYVAKFNANLCKFIKSKHLGCVWCSRKWACNGYYFRFADYSLVLDVYLIKRDLISVDTVI